MDTGEQEAIIGRTKLDDVELDDAVSGQRSHKTLTTITDENGVEHDILRDDMPFGPPRSGEFGTYFIGYARNLSVIERMLERMFIGDPPGDHDRLLDFSTPLTGTTFLRAPIQHSLRVSTRSSPMSHRVGAEHHRVAGDSVRQTRDTSLGIGSLNLPSRERQ